MAYVRILNSNATLSTSAGSWSRCTAQNINYNAGSGYYDDCNTARSTPSFTPASSVSLKGVWFVYNQGNLPSGTFTIALMEGVTQRAISATLNITDLGSTSGAAYYAFGTPYTTTGASYTIKITCNTSGKLYWRRSTTAGDYAYAVVDNTDDSTKIGSGDTAILVQNTTLTVDENLTMGIIGSNWASLMISDGSKFYVPNPASPITIAFGGGRVGYSFTGTYQIGDSGTRISAGYVTITNSLGANNTIFDIPGSVTVNTNNIQILHYGTLDTNMAIRSSGDSATNQPVVNTIDDIPSSWVASSNGTDGDKINLIGKDSIQKDSVDYYLWSKGTKTITLSLSRTATMTNANPCVVSIATHGFQNGDAVVFTTAGTLPSHITAGTTYYARSTASGTFNLYDTSAHAIAGGGTGQITNNGFTQVISQIVDGTA